MEANKLPGAVFKLIDKDAQGRINELSENLSKKTVSIFKKDKNYKKEQVKNKE